MGLSIFVFGASKGIGYELVKQYSDDPSNTVIGTVRSPGSDLEKLASQRKNVHVITVDVLKSPESVETLAKKVEAITPSLDILITNGGSVESTGLKIMDVEEDVFVRQIENNVFTHIVVIKKLLPFLKANGGGKLGLTSSVAGLVQSADGSFNFGAYGMSKAALNYIAKSLSFELKEDGIVVIPFHPGLVGTEPVQKIFSASEDMKSAFEALVISPEESVKGIIKLIDGASLEQSGKFFLWNGEEHDY